MVSLMAPETLVWPLPLQTKELRPLGTGSLTPTLVAVAGPLLPTVMVYVKLVPGTTVPVLGVIDEPPLLSVLVTLTSLVAAAAGAVIWDWTHWKSLLSPPKTRPRMFDLLVLI